MAFSVSSSSKNNTRSGRRRVNLMSEINVTPMVDVMLVLLIIFMVTSPMLVAGVKVDLPETTASAISGQDEPLSITVDKNGKIYLMDTLIDDQNLIEKLKAVTSEKYDTRIFVRGDKNSSYGDIINVVSQINSAGFTKVALITNIKQHEK
jgi:biopolymer transport protein TolR